LNENKIEVRRNIKKKNAVRGELPLEEGWGKGEFFSGKGGKEENHMKKPLKDEGAHLAGSHITAFSDGGFAQTRREHFPKRTHHMKERMSLLLRWGEKNRSGAPTRVDKGSLRTLGVVVHPT